MSEPITHARSSSCETEREVHDEVTTIGSRRAGPAVPHPFLDAATAAEVVRWLRRRRLARPRDAKHSDARIVARIVHLQRDGNAPPGQSLRDVLQHAVASELVAIRSLRQMIPFLASDDPSTRPLVEGLLAVEEQHVHDLSDLIAELRP